MCFISTAKVSPQSDEVPGNKHLRCKLAAFNVCLLKSISLNKMKILSWNINGIRANKRSLKKLFNSLDADVICLQETKVTRKFCVNGVDVKTSLYM